MVLNSEGVVLARAHQGTPSSQRDKEVPVAYLPPVNPVQAPLLVEGARFEVLLLIHLSAQNYQKRRAIFGTANSSSSVSY